MFSKPKLSETIQTIKMAATKFIVIYAIIGNPMEIDVFHNLMSCVLVILSSEIFGIP